MKQSLFSCPWFHSVGGESNTMIEDEGAGGLFFFFQGEHLMGDDCSLSLV